MEKIEIGEYARTIDGIFGKIVKYDNFEYHIKISEDDIWKCGRDFIVKHSKQLKDLIEVGDYVNGYKVINIIKNKINNNKLIAVGNTDYEFETVKELTETNGIKLLGCKDIKTILTKEQFEANCYKVGGEYE